MSGSISKIASAVAFPKNKNDNILNFNVGNENGQIDMKASYLELEVTLDNITNYNNVTLGRDGIQYNPSALIRSSKLAESQSGKIYQDLVYTNIISNNMDYWSKGCNEVVANALFNGNAHVGYTGGAVSVFDNTYADSTPVIKCPLSCLYPGSIGQSDLFPQEQDLSFSYLLEPQYNVFMRAVQSNLYGGTGSVGATGFAFGNINTNATTATAGTTGIIGNFSSGQNVLISAIQNASHVVIPATVTSVAGDTGATPGILTFSTTPAVGNPLSAVQIYTLSNTNTLSCANLPTGSTGYVLNLNTAVPLNGDLYQNTTVMVYYTTVTSGGVATAGTPFKTTLSAVTGSPITSVTLTNAIPIPPNGCAVNIYFVPLYTNLDSSNWSLNNAHLVLYRRQVPVVKEKQMLISNFESVNVAMVGGLNRFLYNLKARSNTYNAYVLTPNQTNLISIAEGIRSYLISVDDKPLTTIYIDTQGPAVHNDNMIRVLANSTEYQPKNLSQYRDKEILTDISPVMFPGKIFHSVMKGEPNVQDFNGQDRNLKIELVADTANGLTTPQKTVYVFLEKYDVI